MSIRFKSRALDDLEAIHSYIAQFDPAAATRVLRRIEVAIQRLSQFPLSGRKGTVRGTRHVVVRGLPYIVIYRVRSDVEITAVVHAARRRRS